MERTREYIGIIRAIVARERPLEHQGEHYRIPYDGPDATGLGKPLKSILHASPLRFYCASITPGGMRLSGEIADGTREASHFGINATFNSIDMTGVNSYKDGVVTKLHKGLQGLVKSRSITYIEGHGKLVAKDAVEVNGVKYTGKNIVLATGSYPKTLPGLEVDGKRVMTSEHAIKLDYVPKSVIVLGGGVIGCEFASVWKSFGAEVTIIEGLSHLVALEDESSSKQLERAYRKRGINFELGVRFKSHAVTADGVTITLEDGKTFSAEVLLVAVGRGPVSANLGYEEQGITMDRGYVLVDDKCRTNVPGIWAVGDLIPTLK
jgi:dihydrolipoamide dehydrogenase